jgi:IclR family transcriptional regulator, KDG regulon repressor
MDDKYLVPAVDNAMKILNLLSRYNYKKSTLSDISNTLSISKSSCSRILKTLEKEKFVSYDNLTKRYSLGIHLMVLGSRASEHIDYLSIAKTYLKKLTKEISMTTLLIERISFDKLMVVAKEAPENGEKINIYVGNQFNLQNVSYGNCFLAYMGDDERTSLLDKGYREKAKYLKEDKELYIKELEEIRKKGYVVNLGEYYPGINSISVPVFNRNGEVSFVVACITFREFESNNEIQVAINTLQKMVREFSELYLISENINEKELI